MSWHPRPLRGRANKKDLGEKNRKQPRKKTAAACFPASECENWTFPPRRRPGQIVIVQRPLTLPAGVWVCLAFVEEGRCRSSSRVGVWGLKDRADVVSPVPPPSPSPPPSHPQSTPRGKCAAMDGRGQGKRGGVSDTASTTGPLWFPWRPGLHH